MHTTPRSLLLRLRQPGQDEAWGRFVDLYTPLLFHWARRLGLGQEDAADLVQDVFTVLVRRLPDFTLQAGKRFRAWLWTVTLNKHRERGRRKRGPTLADAEVDLDQLAGPGGAEPFDEAEYRQYLARRALELMQADFEPATWRACWEYGIQGRPAAEVAAELGLTVNAVHLAKSRVLRRLREELSGLLD
jgi:RNA polymerase sigma-70 factor (ECF subfamily)